MCGTLIQIAKRALPVALFGAAAIAFYILLPVSTPSVQPAMARVNDAQIFAVYRISFNGLALGKFKFWSKTSPKSYSMKGKANFKVISSLFYEWNGTTKSSGMVTRRGPLPEAFSFHFKSAKKTEMLNMEFKRNKVRKIIAVPPKKPSKKRIPLLEEHLKDVVDPMSALMILTKSNGRPVGGREVCGRRMPVFDGRERFDLQLSYKKTVRLEKSSKKGISGKAIVCRVHYHPIAGHKPKNKGVKFLKKTEDIEVWLVPIPEADMYLPYQIVLPTPLGYAYATSTNFEISRPGRGRIAFKQ